MSDIKVEKTGKLLGVKLGSRCNGNRVNLGIIIKRLFSRFDTDENGSLSHEELVKSLYDILPGVDIQSIDGLARRFDRGGKGSIELHELTSILTALVMTGECPGLPPPPPPPPPLRTVVVAPRDEEKKTKEEDMLDEKVQIVLRKIAGRVLTLATEAYATICSKRRLPLRREALLRELGYTIIKEKLNQARASIYTKLTQKEMTTALERHFRTPGQATLFHTDCIASRIWELSDHGDPNAFIQLYKEHIVAEDIKNKESIFQDNDAICPGTLVVQKKQNILSSKIPHDSSTREYIYTKTNKKKRSGVKADDYPHARLKDTYTSPPIKLRYKYSRTLVSPPVGSQRMTLARCIGKSAQPPKKKLQLEHAFGFTPDMPGPNLFYSHYANAIIYATAALVVIQREEKEGAAQQHFFQGHTDDVSCCCLDPSGRLAASGQVASEDTQPYLCVWDIMTGRQLLQIDNTLKGLEIQRLVCAVCFFQDASHLAFVAGDDRHTMYIYNMASNSIVYTKACKSGVSPPAIYALYSAPTDTAQRIAGADELLVTVGRGHLAFWQFDMQTQKGLVCNRRLPTYGKRRTAPSAHLCAAFVPRDDAILTGASDGKIYIWRNFAIAHTIQAHRQDIPVRALIHLDYALCSGGADGLIKFWLLERGRYILKDIHSPSNPHQKKNLLSLTDDNDDHPILKKRRHKKGGSTSVAFDDMRKSGNRGISDLAAPGPDANHIYLGTAFGQVLRLDDIESINSFTVLTAGHHATTTDVCAHPRLPLVCATTGLDCLLCIWQLGNHPELSIYLSLPGPGTCLALLSIDDNGNDHCCVGLTTGGIVLYSLNFKKKIQGLTLEKEIPELSKQPLSQVRYSPNGKYLAASSHDCSIYILKTSNYTSIRILTGHSSYITHLDWSCDSMLLQTTCGAYEILYWNIQNGIQMNSTHDSVESDTNWFEYTLTLGFPVMGIFEPDSDGTDVNTAHRSHDGSLIIVGDDNGFVKLFNAPAICKSAAHRRYLGHSAHCVAAKFLLDDTRAVTTGGRDAALLVWRLTDADQSNNNDDSLHLAEDIVLPPAAKPAWIAGCDLSSSTDILRKPPACI